MNEKLKLNTLNIIILPNTKKLCFLFKNELISYNCTFNYIKEV